jgi:hypothetical protein
MAQQPRHGEASARRPAAVVLPGEVLELRWAQGVAAQWRICAAVHANRMLWFFSGNDRMRCPVAAKIA